MEPKVKYKLGNVCHQITDGKHGDCVNQNGSGYYFISSKDVFDGSIHYENARQITKNDFEDTHKRTKLAEGDILITNSGTIGRMALVKNDSKLFQTTFQKSVAVLKPNKEIVDNKYLYYLLLALKTRLIRLAGGAAQKNLLLGDLREFPIEAHEYQLQCQIASTLSIYDELIENNEKRIKILEEMAQRLYTEWFVKFKFPGHENVSMVDSGTEFGKIPEGWEVKRIKDIGKVITGKTPSTIRAEYYGRDVPFIKTPDIHGNIFVIEAEQKLSQMGADSQSNKYLPAKTVFISCIGTLGVVGVSSQKSQTNQQINAVLLNDPSDYCMFYFFSKDLKKVLLGLGSNGATMGNVNKDKFENMFILYPSQEIRKAYSVKAVGIFDEILLFQQRNKALQKTRDLLIPQLVTGKRELK